MGETMGETVEGENPPPQVLIVDDDRDICSLLEMLIAREGMVPQVAHDAGAAFDAIMESRPDFMITDVRMPGENGIDLISKVNRRYAETIPTLVITGYAGVQGAVEALQSGAVEYLPKPFNNDDVIRIIRRELGTSAPAHKGRRDPSGRSTPHQTDDIVAIMGRSGQIGKLEKQVSRVARTNFCTVVHGETGAGKDVVAHAMHSMSPCSEGAYVPVDCGAIPETLFESEMFGHRKGAFTGADRDKKGFIEAADGGTLFLDEVANLPASIQVKLLRVLQEKMFYRIGDRKPTQVNTRIIAASNEDLFEKVKRGEFREDLYYRLNDITIEVPPLRQRKKDILYLAKRFLVEAAEELGEEEILLDESSVAPLLQYSWPGNVRELRTVIRRAALSADEGIIQRGHLQLCRDGNTADEQCEEEAAVVEESWVNRLSTRPVLDLILEQKMGLKEIVCNITGQLEAEVIREVLKQTGNNKSMAARILRIDYKTLYNKMHQYEIGGMRKAGNDGTHQYAINF